jgi:outer membrane protein OmpA-like peptidoglycan-associated protein
MRNYLLFLLIFVSSGLFAQKSYTVQPLCENIDQEVFAARSFNNDIYVISYDHDSIGGWDNQKQFTEISLLTNCALLPATLFSAKHQANIPISSLKNDGPISASSDGNLLFFSNNSDAQLGYQMGIFYLAKTDSGWSESNPFPLNSADYSCIHPFYDQAAKKLFFSSNMPGEGNKYSIYSIPFDGSRFGDHQHESSINSEYNEVFPSVYNGNIYFTSDRPNGIGGMDIYALVNDSIQLLPHPINSEQDDLAYFQINETSAFISTNRYSQTKDQTFFVRIKQDQNKENLAINSSNSFESNQQKMTSQYTNFFHELESKSTQENTTQVGKTIHTSAMDVVDNLEQINQTITQTNSTIANNWSSFEEELEALLFNEDLSALKEKIALEEEIRTLIGQLNSSNPQQRNAILDELKTKLMDYDEELANKLIPKLNEITTSYALQEQQIASLNDQQNALKDLAIIQLRQEVSQNNMSLEQFVNNYPDKLSILDVTAAEIIHNKIGVVALQQIIDNTESITLLFAFDSYSISKKDNEKLLDLINLTLAVEGIELQIEGHTDNTGPAQYNLLLSERRALTVKKRLVKNGINDNVFKIKFFGLTQPKFDNSTREGRKQNRRVHIKLVIAEG